MSTSSLGLLAGLLLAVAAATGGFGGFLLAVVLGAVGWLLGAHLEGRVDLGQWLRSRRNV
jgi:hypothetical protein